MGLQIEDEYNSNCTKSAGKAFTSEMGLGYRLCISDIAEIDTLVEKFHVNNVVKTNMMKTEKRKVMDLNSK